MKKRIIVTCGPSFEAIDNVRRITNFSSGELGVRLAETLAGEGFDVLCFKGSGATWSGPNERCVVDSFDTNDDLLRLLREAATGHDVGAIFHVAALCDYKVKFAEDERGERCNSPKIASRSGGLTIRLEPATKVISEMRALFPDSIIVGWKYELSGSRETSVAKAWKQIAENGTDACVLNGAAYGPGFALCEGNQTMHRASDKWELIQLLKDWLVGQRVSARLPRSACHLL